MGLVGGVVDMLRDPGEVRGMVEELKAPGSEEGWWRSRSILRILDIWWLVVW